MVQIVGQGGSNCSIKLVLSDNLDRFSEEKNRAVPIIQQSGSISPNGQNVSGNGNHKLNKLCYSVSVSFKFISACLNQYLDAGKRNGHLGIGDLQKKVQSKMFSWSYHTDLL